MESDKEVDGPSHDLVDTENDVIMKDADRLSSDEMKETDVIDSQKKTTPADKDEMTKGEEQSDSQEEFPSGQDLTQDCKFLLRGLSDFFFEMECQILFESFE